jgi:hypothetical protein
MRVGAVGPLVLQNYYTETSHQPSAVSGQLNSPFAEGEKLKAEG